MLVGSHLGSWTAIYRVELHQREATCNRAGNSDEWTVRPTNTEAVMQTPAWPLSHLCALALGPTTIRRGKICWKARSHLDILYGMFVLLVVYVYGQWYGVDGNCTLNSMRTHLLGPFFSTATVAINSESYWMSYWRLKGAYSPSCRLMSHDETTIVMLLNEALGSPTVIS